MDKKTKIMEKTSLRTSKAMFSTCNVFACILQNLDLSLAKFMFTPLSGHVLHDVNNSVKRKQSIIFFNFFQIITCVFILKQLFPLGTVIMVSIHLDFVLVNIIILTNVYEFKNL